LGVELCGSRSGIVADLLGRWRVRNINDSQAFPCISEVNVIANYSHIFCSWGIITARFIGSGRIKDIYDAYSFTSIRYVSIVSIMTDYCHILCKSWCVEKTILRAVSSCGS
jgi:hypothetical protein